ncbi:ectoine/hydroxyectoine ABC transporter ATP-binding protein EhuA [Prauserella marina]|uniref:Polar amino acid transport system ATP-binding protein n=1 Tax=Prauserella marina TaxID=530584 RepID=A0A222VV54_9PSEU|nr:ectoine/hydroxyectoine ABC transporter ATP-binding protein EhuA [Prauserella marina]ASR37784.1 ectoine/hydroxyectoine ABC transporter ATP-binding protein EhuA [Prauserella marina]PWV75738.1 amino acid ABC transporter ATP-binding protein (PAAT family) [Prauserella marina]SDD27434.1 polar amino acid transport system ATP-binding protein [Prauserella marina]
MTNGDFITFEGVHKAFGQNVVLDDLSFSVGSGERVTLIGPSGSGKTTILRMLMTLTRPDRGTIKVNGDYLYHEQRGDKLVPASEAHIRKVRSRITMVFQHFNLFPNMKVLRNVTEAPIHVLGKSKDEAEARGKELLEMVGLSDKLDAHPSQLSGGQQQRVAIARALAVDPDVLLLDEVTSALDPEIAAEVLDVLRDIAKTTDVTMLLVTHAMKFARDVSHRVLMFNEGRIIEDGTPEQLFNEPEQDRTRTFLKSVLDET